LNFHKSLGMICISQIFGDIQDFTYIAGIRNKLSFSIDIGRLDVVNFSQVLV